MCVLQCYRVTSFCLPARPVWGCQIRSPYLHVTAGSAQTWTAASLENNLRMAFEIGKKLGSRCSGAEGGAEGGVARTAAAAAARRRLKRQRRRTGAGRRVPPRRVRRPGRRAEAHRGERRPSAPPHAGAGECARRGVRPRCAAAPEGGGVCAHRARRAGRGGGDGGSGAPALRRREQRDAASASARRDGKAPRPLSDGRAGPVGRQPAGALGGADHMPVLAGGGGFAVKCAFSTPKILGSIVPQSPPETPGRGPRGFARFGIFLSSHKCPT